MPEFINLPTQKPHISFSELRDWKECSYRHKLKYVRQIVLSKPGVHMDFGTAIHAGCEQFLKTGTMNVDVFTDKLNELWQQRSVLMPEEYTPESLNAFKKEGLSILADVPAWFNKQFPGWEFIDAEHALYEPIVGHPHAFKGFIDCIIKAPGPRGKSLVWLLDFKTCSWGWSVEKKSDDLVRAQLTLYKNFWSAKTNTDPKNIRCGFVLLKRSAKQGQHCELVTTSVGAVTTTRSLTVINNMLCSVKKDVAIKNRTSCTYCEYYNTEHCT